MPRVWSASARSNESGLQTRLGLHTIEISGLSRMRTELVHLAVVLALAPHLVQMNFQFAAIATFVADWPFSV